jgi:hypothetical protein
MNAETQSRRERAQWVARWKASGRTATEFGAEHGLTAGKLYGWAREGKGETREATFVEVRARDLATVAAPAGVVEVLLRGGRVVRVSGVVDPSVLRSVVEALESC